MFGGLLCGSRSWAKAAWSKYFPRSQTAWICVALWMSARGSARSKTRFAILPGSMTLKSFAFNLVSPPARNSAGLMVADCRAARGVRPECIIMASSSCRLKPGKQKGFMTSVPARSWYSGAKHSAEDVLVSGKDTASKLILLVGPDAELRLDALLPACAGFFADVGEGRK
jgi:hypothetical protein